MSMFPLKHKGEVFRPDVNFDNACRNMVNTLNHPSARNKKHSNSGNLPVINRTGNVIQSGTAIVRGDEDFDVNFATAIKPAQPGDTDFFILCNTIGHGEVGSAVVSGLAFARVESGVGKYVTVGENNGNLVQSTAGRALLLSSVDNQNGLRAILLRANSDVFQFFVDCVMEDGKLKIFVTDATDPESTKCGTLNSVPIEKTTIELPLSDGTYYVYAVAWQGVGRIVALNHQYHDEIVPMLLCGTIKVVNGNVSAYQKNFENYPVVDVESSSSGNVYIDTEITAEDTALTIKHSIRGIIQHNNTVFEIPKTELTQGINMCCNVYAEKLTVENGVTPTVGFEIVAPETATEHDFDLEVMRYSLSDNGFSIDSRNSNPQIFTFTVIALNANEVS